ncbi:uncharacterized protein LOC124419704 [Lucilia cuprina]|uniref:uncharacterized protein LOC124419704 n=1 Tax=Lucilia cuprina TaxID=7375 RepID=UPI001F05903B|nr:uncharacterized protein LOC124419704 [Lucilia cuprina]
MVAIKLLIFIVILASLMCSDIVEAAAKKQRRNVKNKKSTQNGKLKGNLKAAPASKPNQRNGKMNYYNTHFWPSTSTYYRPATSSPLFLRSPSTSSSSTMFYPMHWSNSYMNPSSFMSSNSLRRTDEFPSSPIQSQAQSSMMSMPSSSSPIISMGNSQIPTLYDMSAFTGNSALLEHPFGNSNQNLWSVGETVAPSSKSKLNLFNSFNYNDDGGLFSGFLNQFLK